MSRFNCLKCNFQTNGEERNNRRWCIRCKSLLKRCDHCHMHYSMTKKDLGYECDGCNKLQRTNES